MKKLLFVFTAIGITSLSGCAVTMTAVPAGVVETEAAFTVNASDTWTRFPKGLNSTPGSILTKDGVGLNQVYIVTVEDGTKMIKSPDKAKNFPTYEKGLSQLKQVEFVTTNLSRLGFANLEPSAVEPAVVGGVDGIKMQLSGQYPNGLNMKGKVAMAENDSGLNLVMYMAPAMHYYGKDVAEVDGLINSIRFTE